MKAPLGTAIAIGVGLVVLVGYFVALPLLQNVRMLLVGWGTVLVGVATLVGIINLVQVHWKKAIGKSPSGTDHLSILLVLVFLVTFAAGVWLTPAHAEYQKIVTQIQKPVEVSLMSLLSITLLTACLRLMQRRKGLLAVIFLVSSVLFILILSGAAGYFGGVPGVDGFLRFMNMLPTAGARGILLGVALGSLTTTLRILLGTERPYGR